MKIKRTDWATALLVLSAEDPMVRRIEAKMQAVENDMIAVRVQRHERSRIDEAIAIGRLRVVQAAGVLSAEASE